MKTIKIKEFKNIPPFIEISEDFVKALDIEPGDKINMFKDEHGYVSIYKCSPLSSESGFNVGIMSATTKNLRATIPSTVTNDYFGEVGTMYECTDEPCWDETIEKLIFELNKI